MDGSNFLAALSTEALQKMEIVIQRSAAMAARVKLNREACGGAAALRRQVLQTSSSDRSDCAPDEAAPPVSYQPADSWICSVTSEQDVTLAEDQHLWTQLARLKHPFCP